MRFTFSYRMNERGKASHFDTQKNIKMNAIWHYDRNILNLHNSASVNRALCKKSKQIISLNMTSQEYEIE